MIDLTKIKVGDRITFRAITRWSCAKATRVVTEEARPNRWGGSVGVRYGGYVPFWVRADEIIEHHPRDTNVSP